MCGIFGFIRCDKKNIKGLQDITNELAVASSIRGTDATGIAFSRDNKIRVLKTDKPAYEIEFNHGDDIQCLIGHTRHSTRGSEKNNYNNHPFTGKTKNAEFALAHNGVLWNDKVLRIRNNIKETEIKTDSYIAVQLLENKGCLDMDNIKYMAEAIDGSFAFSIMDNKNNLYLVKGSNPISIVYFPKYKMYVYASTLDILVDAVKKTILKKEFDNNRFNNIVMNRGDILKISTDGKIEEGKFNLFENDNHMKWWEFRK